MFIICISLDVEELLPQVKDSKLNTKGRKLKKEIQQHIQQLRDEKPQLATTNNTGSIPGQLLDTNLFKDVSYI